jgi:hypothetical protein
MIYESSKDYGTGEVTLLFDNRTPSYTEISEHVEENYSMTSFSYMIEEPTEYNGLVNPGIVRVIQQ